MKDSLPHEPIQTDKIDIGHTDRMDFTINSPGGMGLKGLWALVGNSTAMVILAIVMFSSLLQVNTMHREGMETLKTILDRQVERQDQAIRDNTQAIRDLSLELHSFGVKMDRRKHVE